MKKAIRSLISVLMILMLLCTSAFADISILVNDKKLVTDVQPFAEKGRTLVPLRAIFEALGAQVHWDGNTQTVTADREGTKISLKLNSNIMSINGKDKYLDVPAKAVNSRTFVPVRAVAEAFGCYVGWSGETDKIHISEPKTRKSAGIPSYSGNPYVAVNGNVPYFDIKNYKSTPFEMYLPLDKLGRCTYGMAMVCKDIMPVDDRGSISSVKPTGWNSVTYDNVSGGYLYNRCHLIGYQLSGENANELNLITGTRYLNIDGMLPFENMIADYIEETSNRVLYRVTPFFEGNDLVAKGVLMEAMSYEDKGKGICFNVFCYNVQPGITINYADGTSYSSGGSSKISESTAPTQSTSSPSSVGGSYVLNTNSKKFHYPSCSTIKRMKSENREDTNLSREQIIILGYVACGVCKP